MNFPRFSGPLEPRGCSEYEYDENREKLVTPSEVQEDLDLADWTPQYLFYSENSERKYFVRGLSVSDVILSENYAALIGSICMFCDEGLEMQDTVLGMENIGIFTKQKTDRLTILKGFIVKDLDTFYKNMPDKVFTG